MTPQDFDHEAANYGHVLVPPVMGAQIELLYTTALLTPLQLSVRKRLQELVEANNPKAWMTVYLCTFILLHNLSLISQYQHEKARKKGLKVRRPLDWVLYYCLSD